MDMWLIPEKFRMRRWILAWQAAFNGFAGAQDLGCVSVLCDSTPLLAGPGSHGASRGECAIIQRFCMNAKKTSGFVVLSLSNRHLFPSAPQWGVRENLFSRRCRESGGIVLKSVWFVWCEIILTPVGTKTALILRAVSAGFSRQLGSVFTGLPGLNSGWIRPQLQIFLLSFFSSDAFYFLYYHTHTQIYTQKSVMQQKILNVYFSQLCSWMQWSYKHPRNPGKPSSTSSHCLALPWLPSVYHSWE